MNRRNRPHQQGFTLIELMIVVAIIAIIAAIAIPSLMSARMSANEGSAISSLRVMSSVSEQYRIRFGSYPTDLATLQANDYIDVQLATGSKSGYDFFYAGGAGTWLCIANPTTPGRTGERYFFVDDTGVIRFDGAAVASSASAPID